MQPYQFLPPDHCRFTVWAPEKESMVLQITAPYEQLFPMQKDEWGYFSVDVKCTGKDLCYFYKPEGGNACPDPASHFQPEGVHGPSQTVDHGLFRWSDDAWKGLPSEELVIYELHVGTFTPEGTFEAIIPRLDSLKKTGITALEIMPVSQFPGGRNWGYDSVYPYAVQNSYGGPEGLKKLVDTCHQKGLAVFLDVVYNHLGPEGNYFSQFGPYFTNKYSTPWGDALNFDGEWSDGVREFFSENVLHWMKHYHIDGLRCDAIHAVFDNGAVHFWELAHRKVKALEQQTGRRFHLIAESDLNSPKVVRSPEEGGYGFDAQWLDDFHHALYVLINPKDKERYYDFGTMEQLAKAYTDGFVHSGEWVKFRKRKHGASSAGVPGSRFVAFNLNHDQAGNRAGGERLCMLVEPERVKLAAAALLLSPYVPLLFMGEEYADDTPFYYFVSHSDKDLIRAVQEGRKEEFSEFGFDAEVPDPQAEDTFLRSKIHWEKQGHGEHKIIRQWHEELLRLRGTLTPLKDFDKKNVQVEVISQTAFALSRKSGETGEKLLCLFNLSEEATAYQVPVGGKKILDSTEPQWTTGNSENGPVFPQSIQLSQSISLLPLSVVIYQADERISS